VRLLTVRIAPIVRAGRLLVLLSLSLVPLPGTSDPKLHGTVSLAYCPRPFEWASSARARRVSGLDRNDARRLPARRLKERFRWPSSASGLAWFVYPPAISPTMRLGSQDTMTWLNTSTEVRRQTHVAQKAVPFPPPVDCLQ